MPDDYKPCIGWLPNGELFLVAFHQHKKDRGEVLAQNLLLCLILPSSGQQILMNENSRW